MKDSHLTLRLPDELSRALDRMAGARDLPKSQLVREAVAAYLSAAATPAEPERTLAARALARRWAAVPRLDAHEARAFGADLRDARRELPVPDRSWE